MNFSSVSQVQVYYSISRYFNLSFTFLVLNSIPPILLAHSVWGCICFTLSYFQHIVLLSFYNFLLSSVILVFISLNCNILPSLCDPLISSLISYFLSFFFLGSNFSTSQRICGIHFAQNCIFAVFVASVFILTSASCMFPFFVPFYLPSVFPSYFDCIVFWYSCHDICFHFISLLHGHFYLDFLCS